VIQTFAYEIGGVFLLAAILMGGGFLRGFFSQEILRGFKLAAAGLALAGAAIWIYRTLDPEPVEAPVQAVNPALDPAIQEQKAKRAAAFRESDRKALARAMAEEAAKPDIPMHIHAGGTPDTMPEKRGHKMVQSVGRALRIVPKAQP
jgi:cytosine/adenosine deaminase-related metal-dependent hydrolase